jgi:hypothetical protein
MGVIRAGVRPALGLFVLAHGLAHAMLPHREWMEPAALERDFIPLVLYGVAVLGFTISGLGLFGLRPFASMMRPAMVLASAYSLIAISRFGQADIWWGSAAADVVLFVTGLSGAYRYLPAWRITEVHFGHGAERRAV